MALLEEPLLTEEYDRAHFKPGSGAGYLYAASAEERSSLTAWLQGLGQEEQPLLFEVVENDDDTISVPNHDEGSPIDLRDEARLKSILAFVPEPTYLDITGLTHRAWAPLLRAAVSMGRYQFRLVYIEPKQYSRNPAPAPGSVYDLSERIAGISPLPGFASLAHRLRERSTRFVPLLGFEGARLGHMLNELDPDPARITPIVGVPGFRIEYPFTAFLGNRDYLAAGFIFRNVRYAKANCPFSAFQMLHKVATDFPKDLLQVAPIGTKPHGLGAILFVIARSGRAELIYDNPVRKASRTVGEARACVYHVGAFAQSELYQGSGRYA